MGILLICAREDRGDFEDGGDKVGWGQRSRGVGVCGGRVHGRKDGGNGAVDTILSGTEISLVGV